MYVTCFFVRGETYLPAMCSKGTKIFLPPMYFATQFCDVVGFIVAKLNDIP